MQFSDLLPLCLYRDQNLVKYQIHCFHLGQAKVVVMSGEIQLNLFNSWLILYQNVEETIASTSDCTWREFL